MRNKLCLLVLTLAAIVPIRAQISTLMLAGKAGSSSGTGCTHGATYSNCITFTIDHTKVPNTDQTNFPVLISQTVTEWKTAANGGHVQNTVTQSGGTALTIPADLIFTSDSSCATPVAGWQFNAYTATTGASAVWVNVASVSHTTDTSFYACYNAASVTTQQNTVSATWDTNYKGVYHLEDNAANTTVADSTSNATTLTNNVNTSTVTGAAEIVNGLTYDGAAGKSYTASANVQQSVFTIDGWVNLTSTPGSPRGIWGSDTSGAIEFRVNDSPHNLTLLKQGVAAIGTSSGTISLATWTHVAATYDGSGNYAFYINGAPSGTGTNLQTFSFTGSNNGVGGSTGGPELWFGTVDEIRFSGTARSADWIATEYNNQNSPGTFLSRSTEH